MPVTVIGSTFLQTTYEARMEAQHLPVKTGLGVLRGAVGMQWSNRDLQAAGADGVLLNPTNTQSLAGFVFEELQPTKKLRLQAAARIESDDVKGTASTFPPGFLPPPNDPTQSLAQRHFTPKSISAGVLYDLPYGVVARFTAQHAERAPDATELFYKGPHDSTATFEIGNPNLTIEAANTYEIGFKRAKGDFRFDVSVYHTDFRNFIYKRFTGAKCDSDFASCGTGTELDQIVYSQQNATFRRRGALAELRHRPHLARRGGIEGQYDFVHAVLADGTLRSRMPPHRPGGHLLSRRALACAREPATLSRSTSSPPSTRRRRATQSAQRRAQLHRQARSPSRCSAGDHLSASGARTCSTTTSATARSSQRRTRCCSRARIRVFGLAVKLN